MKKAKCSDMPRYWALATANGKGFTYDIFDRDHADKRIALMQWSEYSQEYRCVWNDAAYWNEQVSEWRQAVERAKKGN